MRRTIVVGAALLLGASGCVSSSKFEKKEAEATASAAAAKEAGEKAAACEAKLKTVSDELTASTQAKDELQVKMTSLQEEKDTAVAKSAQYEQLASSLQKEIQAGQVEVTELKGKMIVKLKDKILFPSGSARLNREGREALDRVADAFKDVKAKNVLVAGFTDDVRVAANLPFKDNWELSAARATAVVRYLASKGVPPVMLGAAGFGEFRPVAPNDSPANRSLNRRIEIALTPADYTPPEVDAAATK
ncbi:MAG: OmpA family protein [Anaeromyxobacter sp.]